MILFSFIVPLLFFTSCLNGEDNFLIELQEIKLKMNEFSKEMEIRDEKIQVLEREMKIKDDKLVNLETSLAIIRNPPYLNLCASQHVFAGVSQAISYESIFFSAYNEEWQDSHGMDISSGVFTAPISGIYSVTYSLMNSLHSPEEIISIFVHKNGERIPESEHFSKYAHSGTTGWTYDQGGRSITLHLNSGDRLELWCEDCAAEIVRVLTCISLVNWDVI